jgi:hypothetical protein
LEARYTSRFLTLGSLLSVVSAAPHSGNTAVHFICTLFTLGTLLSVVSAGLHSGNTAVNFICTLFTLGTLLSVVSAGPHSGNIAVSGICTFFLLYNTIREVCHSLIKSVNQIRRLAILLIYSPVESTQLFQSFGQILTYPMHQCFIYLHPPHLSIRLSYLHFCKINK